MSKIVGAASEFIYYNADNHNTDDVEGKDTDAADKADNNSLPNVIYLKEAQERHKSHHLYDAGAFIINIQGYGGKLTLFWDEYDT
jgi:hypothetical protein